MDPLESLQLLEDKIHYLMVRYTQLSEENQHLREELENERKNNKSLKVELDNISEERERFEIIKKSVRNKIESLIEQLSFGQSLSEQNQKINSHYLTKEESEALNKPFSSDMFSDTAINFFPEEDT